MKPLSKHLKPITLFLAVTFLVQSCSVYKTVNSETAISSGEKVKVTFKDNNSFKYLRIIEEENELFGVKKINLSNNTWQSKFYTQNILLNKDDILKIEKYDRTNSTFLTVLTVATVLGGLIYIVFQNNFGISIDLSKNSYQ